MSVRITIISCVFPPEPLVTAKTSSAVASGLASMGYRPMVITSFPSRPAGKIYPGYRRKLFGRSMDASGFEMVRCFSIPSAHSSLLSRFLENLSFGFTSALYFLVHPRPSAVFVNTWPVFSAGLIALVANIRRIPMVISVQDVYPESLFSQRRINNKNLLGYLLRILDRWIAHSARAVIVISQSFVEIYAHDRGISREKIHWIPNWIDQHSVEMVSGRKFRSKWGIPSGELLFIYAGNISRSSGLHQFLTSLVKYSELEFWLVVAGEGGDLEACRRVIRSANCQNILFHSPWNAEETSDVLAAADVFLLSTGMDQSLSSVPSKLITYMLASRPVLALVSAESETARVIKTSDCGWVVPPDDDCALIDQISEIRVLTAGEISRKGENGRIFALANFTTEACLPKVMDVICSVTH